MGVVRPHPGSWTHPGDAFANDRYQDKFNKSF